ncbi:MAG: hypothetical protein ACRDZU_12830 [Acidimicrobiales bacterium]
MASLVADLDATVVCPECGHVCPARMQSCTSCLALLRPGEVDLTEDVVRMLSRGMRMHRPSGREIFASGPGCSVLRLHPQGPLMVCGSDGLIEANLAGRGIAARPPLTCSTDGTTLFRLETYGAASRAVVAIDADGAALGTYLHAGGLLDDRIDIRDETSAPVARFEPGPSGFGFQVVETGGDVIATGDRTDVEDDLWLDDQWSLSPTTQRLPMRQLAFVALAVAAKVLLGRPEPVRVREEQERDPDDPDDLLGPIGRSIVEGFSDYD